MNEKHDKPELQPPQPPQKMEQRLSIITLGVADLARAHKFYTEGLGWKASPNSQEKITFIPLNGFALALYERTELAEDAFGDNPPPLPSARACPTFTLAHNVRTPEEVAATLAFAEQAGGKLIKPSQKVFWGGISGYFADPDGFLWEVAHNPYSPLSDNGDLRLPE